MSLNPPSFSGSIGGGSRFPFPIVEGGGARSVTQSLW